MIEAPHEDERVTQERARLDPLRDRARRGVLAEVWSLLASSDDYLTILRQLADIAVPSLADASSVHVVDSSGCLLRVAGITDPTTEQVAQSGVGELVGSLVAVPLLVRGRVLGVIKGRRGDVLGAIVLGHSRRGAFDVRAEQLLIGLASLGATALASARLFAEQHDVIAAQHVEIAAEPAEDAWEFFVRDDGPGIAPLFQAQIWCLFQTLRSRDATDSTGIGLAVARRIVEAHGGRVGVESEEGRGATFRFTWPRTPRRSRSWDSHFGGG